MQAAIPSKTLRIVAYYPAFTRSNQITAFNEVPTYLPDHRMWLTQIAYVLNGAMKGRTNNTGRVLLNENSSTTTVSLSSGLIGKDTLVILIPLSAAAATENGAGSLYVSDIDIDSNQFTITHVNSATPGRKFGYILVG